MLAPFKTDEALLKRLKKAASEPLTKAELEQQRVSFVYGNLPNDSTITREQVAHKIRMNEGEPA
ncbi:hypothetical protein TH8_01255 [Thalassospira profundimaris]|nr:hypothetical protein TH8_01255 [Thalassospira profundimaris]